MFCRFGSTFKTSDEREGPEQRCGSQSGAASVSAYSRASQRALGWAGLGAPDGQSRDFHTRPARSALSLVPCTPFKGVSWESRAGLGIQRLPGLTYFHVKHKDAPQQRLYVRRSGAEAVKRCPLDDCTNNCIKHAIGWSNATNYGMAVCFGVW